MNFSIMKDEAHIDTNFINVYSLVSYENAHTFILTQIATMNLIIKSP